MKFKSVKGEAIVWNNYFPNEGLNPNGEHLHLPFEGGEKVTIIKNYSLKEREVQEIILDESDEPFVEVK